MIDTDSCQVHVRPEQVERIALDLGCLAGKLGSRSRETDSENLYYSDMTNNERGRSTMESTNGEFKV